MIEAISIVAENRIREAMERDDLRVLAVLVTWFGVHAPWVNADRLTRLVSAHPSKRVRAL